MLSDVAIQTNSADKSKIYLKAGQKVIVLKSPKGICLQLESGKVIAIRASIKSGHQTAGVEQKLGSLSDLQNVSISNAGNLLPRVETDVIDISNDDEDEVATSQEKFLKTSTIANSSSLPISGISIQPMNPIVETKLDPVFKEKIVYKPNLVQRKPKMMPPPLPEFQAPKPYESGSFQLKTCQPNARWDEHKNFTNSSQHPVQDYYNNRHLNGSSKTPRTPYKTCKLAREQKLKSFNFLNNYYSV